MNKIILLGLMIILLSFSVNGLADNNTLDNFKLTFANGGTIEFNYTGAKNCSYDLSQNWINITGTEQINGINYSISAGEAWAIYAEDGWLPYDDMDINTDITLRKSKVYLNDVSDDGLLIFSASATLDFNGTKIMGDGTNRGIFTGWGANDNIIIKNGILENYDESVKMVNDKNARLLNMQFIGLDDYGIITSENHNLTITNCSFINITGTDNRGIYNIDTDNATYYDNYFNQVWRPYDFLRSNYSLIENDIIINCTNGVRLRNSYINIINNETIINNTNRGIYLTDDSDYNNITNNYFYNITGAGTNAIQLYQSDNTFISGNIINYTKHNGIDIDSYSNIIENNVIEGFEHNGIDLYLSPLNTEVGGNNIINKNNISKPLNISGSNAILIANSIKNNITNNIIYSGITGTIFNRGISIGGNQSNYGNHVIKDNIINDTLYCLWAESNSSFISNECNDFSNFILIKDYTNAISLVDSYVNLINNTGNSKIYIIESQTKNITINQISNNYDLYTFSNGGSLKINGDSRKSARIENNSIEAIITSPNSICPPDNSTCEINFNGQYNDTIGNNEYMIIIKYSSTSDPYINTLATSISDYTYQYETNKRVDITCTGTGEHTIKQLDDILNINGKIDVYRNNIKIDQIETNEYTMSGCSSWSFVSGTGSAPLQTTSPTSYTILTSIISIFTVLAILALLIYPIKNFEDMSTRQWIKYFIYGIVVIFVGVVTVRVIFSV